MDGKNVLSSEKNNVQDNATTKIKDVLQEIPQKPIKKKKK